MRLVLDANVLVAAMRSDQGASRRLLTAVLDGQCRLLVSASLLIEYEAVLKRTEHRAASGASIDDVDGLLDALAQIALPVEISYLWRPRLADPGDELVLETAVNGRADMLATFDLRHLASAAARFGVAVAMPATILRQLQEQRS
jgi:putative PIN family toxin of toxin-antitoxin system